MQELRNTLHSSRTWSSAIPLWRPTPGTHIVTLPAPTMPSFGEPDVAFGGCVGLAKDSGLEVTTDDPGVNLDLAAINGRRGRATVFRVTGPLSLPAALVTASRPRRASPPAPRLRLPAADS